MAIRVTDEFGSRANPPDSAYPDGSLKNETSPGVSNDGSPLEARVGNDWEGFKQSVLSGAGIVANGNPDSVGNPQILEAIKSITDERFNYDGLIYQGVGNISDYAGQQLQESEKTNCYQFPDNSMQFYGANKSQAFPITIPADPAVPGSGWALVNALTSDSLPLYTDIVYKSSGGNSAVENMIAGIPINAKVGDNISTGAGDWKRVSLSTPSVIGDFSPTSNLYTSDFGSDTDDFNFAVQVKNDTGKSLIVNSSVNYTWTSQLEVSNGSILGEDGGEINVDFDAAPTNNQIWLQVTDNSSIERVKFNYAGSVPRRGVLINHSPTSDGAVVHRCKILGAFGRSIGAGTISAMGVNAKITKNRIVTGRDGLGSSIKISHGYHVSGNYVDGSNEGIVANAVSLGVGISGFYIGYNILKGFDEGAIDLIASGEGTVENNIISELLTVAGGAVSNGFPIRVGQVSYESKRVKILKNICLDGGGVFGISVRADSSADSSNIWRGEVSFEITGNEMSNFSEECLTTSAVNVIAENNTFTDSGTVLARFTRPTGCIVNGGRMIRGNQGGVLFDDTTTLDRSVSARVLNVSFDDCPEGVKFANRVNTGSVVGCDFTETTLSGTTAIALEFLNASASISVDKNTVVSSMNPFSFNGGTTTQDNLDCGDNWDEEGVNKTRLSDLFTGFSGGATLVVPHNLWLRPVVVLCNMNELNDCAPTSVSSTEITITATNNVTSGKGVYIQASV